MKRRRRVEITIERHELTALRSVEIGLKGRCSECRCEVNLLPPQLAAKTAGVSPRTMYRWVEEDRVHYRESSDGVLLICENSLRGK